MVTYFLKEKSDYFKNILDCQTIVTRLGVFGLQPKREFSLGYGFGRRVKLSKTYGIKITTLHMLTCMHSFQNMKNSYHIFCMPNLTTYLVSYIIINQIIVANSNYPSNDNRKSFS